MRDEASHTMWRCAGRARGVLVAGMLVCGFGCAAADAFAGERLSPEFEARRDAPLSSGVAPRFELGSRSVAESARVPGLQFSARKYFAPDQPLEPAAVHAQSLGTTTVWQRLKDYRSNGRVRLVTLFETAGSSISLQAGRHGEPSLQWTSRSLNRGGSTRGLFDHFLAASLGAAGIAFSQPGTGRAFGSASAGGAAPVRPVRPATAIAAANYAP